MSVSCFDVIESLNKSIDQVNLELIDNMTNENMAYHYVCIKPNVTYDTYYQNIKEKWEKIINRFLKQPNKCSTGLAELMNLYRSANPKNIEQIKQFINFMESAAEGNISQKLQKIDVDKLVLDTIATSLLKTDTDTTFRMQPQFMDTITGLAKILANNCGCQLADIYKLIIRKYKIKYQKMLAGKTKNEIVDMLRKDYFKFKEIVKRIGETKPDKLQSNLVDNVSTKMTGIQSFSIEGELDKLIPADLGSLKNFFIKVISTYYKELHPIIWTQIFRGVVNNISTELPFTKKEFFGFMSEQLLLNSGPFILKILQMIRPFLSPENDRKIQINKTNISKIN